MTKILVVRGHQATPWELAPWAELPERFEVRVLRTRSNAYDTSALGLAEVPVRALRDALPRGPLFDLAARVAGDRYLGADDAFAWADVVHAEELSYWFAADAARRRADGGRFKLVQTVWETLPLRDAYRSRHARSHRRDVLAATDHFLPATQRAALALGLEGVERERMTVCPPGIDVARFQVTPEPADPPVVLSPGRLVWEKGHHDVLRAAALLKRPVRVRIVGAGPEEQRLRAHAAELGVDAQIGPAGYDEMPQVFAQASVMALLSLPSAGMGLHPLDPPRAFWEEQFGMVFAEAMAAGLPIVAAESGAIAEVLDGNGTLVAPGDWPAAAEAIAAALEAGRGAHPPAAVQHYSTAAAAGRLAAAYDALSPAS